MCLFGLGLWVSVVCDPKAKGGSVLYLERWNQVFRLLVSFWFCVFSGAEDDSFHVDYFYGRPTRFYFGVRRRTVARGVGAGGWGLAELGVLGDRREGRFM